MRATTTCVLPMLLSSLAACGGDSDRTNRRESTPASVELDIAAASIDVPDACTFIPKAELERLVGRELSEGNSREVPTGFSQCEFETPTQFNVTRKFENPALPESSGFDSIMVTTSLSTRSSFSEFREGLGTSAKDVQGIGDGAYFHGPAVIYVRVGNRGFTIRLQVDGPETEADRARLRATMLSLAKLGTSKL